jgi:hypothetical protein
MVTHVLGLPTSRGRWCSPPRCSGVRRVAQRVLKLCLRTSRIKNILYLKHYLFLFRQDRLRVITFTITFTLNGHRYVSSATAYIVERVVLRAPNRRSSRFLCVLTIGRPNPEHDCRLSRQPWLRAIGGLSVAIARKFNASCACASSRLARPAMSRSRASFTGVQP